MITWCNKYSSSHSYEGQKSKIYLCGLKSRCWQLLFSLEAVREKPRLAAFLRPRWTPVAALGAFAAVSESFVLVVGLSSCCAQAELPCGIRHLGSPTRDQTHTPCIAGQILTPWTTGKSTYPDLFQLLEDAWIPWLVAPPHLQSNERPNQFFSIATLWHFPTSSSSSETVKSTSRPPW